MKMKFLISLLFVICFNSTANDQIARKLTILPELVPVMPFKQDIDTKLQGKIIIHYWASWCGTCVSEISELMKFIKEHHKDLDKIFFVSLDNDIQKYRAFWVRLYGNDKIELNYSNVFSLTDLKGKLSQVGITMVPETYFFNQGRLVRRIIGNVHWNEESLSQFIKGVL